MIQFMVTGIIVALFFSLVVAPVLYVLGGWLQFYRDVVLVRPNPPEVAPEVLDEADREYTKAEAAALAIAIVAGLAAVGMLILHYIH